MIFVENFCVYRRADSREGESLSGEEIGRLKLAAKRLRAFLAEECRLSGRMAGVDEVGCILLSSAPSTIVTGQLFAQALGAMILMPHPYPDPQPLDDFEKIWRRIVRDALRLGLRTVVVVAHGGEMPILLTKLAYRRATGKEFECTQPIGHVTGYCTTCTGKVVYFNPDLSTEELVPGTTLNPRWDVLDPTGVPEDDEPA